jgi:hypothetical protein
VIAAIRSAINTLSKADSRTASHPAPVDVRPPRPEIYLLMANRPPFGERNNGQDYGNELMTNDLMRIDSKMALRCPNLDHSCSLTVLACHIVRRLKYCTVRVPSSDVRLQWNITRPVLRPAPKLYTKKYNDSLSAVKVVVKSVRFMSPVLKEINDFHFHLSFVHLEDI